MKANMPNKSKGKFSSTNLKIVNQKYFRGYFE